MMMKEENNRCILSIKYSIIDTSSDTNSTKTEIERVFIARNKEALLEKIQKFENKLRNKKSKRAFVSEKMSYLKHFLSSWRYTYNSMLKI
ncbi:hypothetical protein HX109_09965 [Galbibacter sp. BG1]|uniref:hypothetical protein n=1 Tax=Galbibacter sp. BG1 TaxID=1170699 RepID=UPI0015BF3116|nr:hypothetical protein [Galbibacter sp. BG1]QLE01864.1 hypothetical protein HX109_09965 [Galbibacter sp. BG1]